MYRQIEVDFTPEEVLKYSRKSQSDDPLMTVEEVLEKHEKILNEWSEKNLGGIIPQENSFREVVSGETIKKRPEMQKLLKLIESPKYKAVLIVEPQRLTRGDLEDIGRTMKLLKHTNTIVLTPQRPYDLRDEYDWDAFERELKRGNEYLEYYKKIQKRGKLLSVSQGNYLGATPPYGFNKISVMDGKRKCPTLEENKEQADAVRLIFDLYVNKDYGRQRIAHYLDAMGVKPPKKKYWSPHTIRDILTNEHYIGKVRWNWRQNVTVVDDGEFIKTRPKNKVGEYLIFDGRHDGIIPEDLYNAAQEKVGRNPRIRKNATIKNPFASIMSCKVCGRSMSYQTLRDKDGNLKAKPRLICSNTSHCDCASSCFDVVFDKMCEVLEQCIEDFEIRLENDAGDSAKLHASLIKNLEKRMEELNAQELSQWEAQSHPDESKRMPHEIFKKLNEKLLKEKQEVQEALCKAYESMPEPVDYQEKIYMFSDCIKALRDHEVDAAEANKLIKLCIDKIEYFRERPQRINGKWTNPPVILDVDLRL